MTSDKKYEAVAAAADYLPQKLGELIKKLPENICENLTEIRLRAGRPLGLTLGGENVFLSEKGSICYLLQHGLYTVSEAELKETFSNMCEHSVYAFSEHIKHGYIPLKNGCRAGLAASAVYENGKISNFCSVSSINLRIAAEHIGSAEPLCGCFVGGLLIAGPPAVGKTTLLRDSVRLISNGIGTARRRVAVIDTRGEIAAVCGSTPTADLGALTDVISGCEKEVGIELALRTLAPQVIAFDEIGTVGEAKAVTNGALAGTDTLCTAHVGSAEELLTRPISKKLILSGAVKHIAFIKALGSTPEIFETSALVADLKNRKECFDFA